MQLFNIMIFISLVITANRASSESLVFKSTEEFNNELINTTEITTSNNKINFEERNKLSSNIGFTHHPFTKVRHSKYDNKGRGYDVVYDIGALGIRQINQKLVNPKASKHFIIAGDSTVFGEGCNDEDTITAKLAPSEKNAHFYNFGMRGGAVHNTLALMNAYPWETLIKEKKGIFIYAFESGWMVQRAIGGLLYVSWNGGQSPYYKLDKKNNLVRQGVFRDRFFISLFYGLINASTWLKKYINDLPRLNEDHILLTAEIIKHIKLQYSEHFPQGKFFVSMRNTAPQIQPQLFVILKNKLESSGISVLPLPERVEKLEEMVIPKIDYHPNGMGNLSMAKIYIDALKKINVLPL